MKNEDGSWIEGDDNIAQEVTNNFKKQFTKETQQRDLSSLNFLSKIIDDADNKKQKMHPTMEELKEIVFSMSTHSAPGPDGVSRKFYHSCWEIIKNDLLVMVLDFFCKNSATKVLHSYLHQYDS